VIKDGGMIGTAVSASLVSLLGVVGATIIILVLILCMCIIILKVSIVDVLSKLISEYKLEKEKHQTEMRLLREQREKEVEKITEPPKYVQKTSQLKYSENGEIREERLYNKKGTGFWGLFAPKNDIKKGDIRYSNDGLNVIDFSGGSEEKGNSDRKHIRGRESELELQEETRNVKKEPEVPERYEYKEAEEKYNDENVERIGNAVFREKEKETQPKTEEVMELDADDIIYEDYEYKYPPIELLNEGKKTSSKASKQMIEDTANALQKTLYSFGVSAKVVDVSVGPAIARYELKPAQGVKVSKIANLADDIALNLAAETIRIEAPIPGKQAVGIEVPNEKREAVALREVIESREFGESTSKISFALRKRYWRKWCSCRYIQNATLISSRKYRITVNLYV
jgi:DNA translocase ftsK/spoIIIE